MNYETPELVEIGSADEIVLGSKKPFCSDANGTGPPLDSVHEDLKQRNEPQLPITNDGGVDARIGSAIVRKISHPGYFST